MLHTSMICKYFLKILALIPMLSVAVGYAQDTAADDAEDAPITVLDQVVPVADDEAADLGPPESAEQEESLSEHEQLLAEFERFKQLEAGGIYDEAENVAKRVVEMSIRHFGPTSNDTAKALSNLALVQHRTENYEAARQNFARAIEIITDNEDNLSPMLINPLTGLGAAQLESGRPDLARQTYGQAVHLTHVNEGPHNIKQVQVLEALAETNLRLGELKDAKNAQDMIYSLNLRYYSDRAIEMVPSLMRRARWQRRTGHILDERATYRRVIRIIESQLGKDDASLVEPLTKLGQSYYFVDESGAASFQAASMASGEMYFKRAVRIADEQGSVDWRTLSETKLALGDYYNYRGDQGRSRKTYREVWEMLSGDEELIAARRDYLETPIPLNAEPLPLYTGGATQNDRILSEPNLREGRYIIAYDINSRGRVANLKIVEAEPADFADMRTYIIRELRSRIYRPRFDDARPIATPNQSLAHTFYYRQDELDKLRASKSENET